MKLFALLLATALAIPVFGAPRPLPIILDTDIGSDVDDAYALILAARSLELDLRGVTTVYGDVALRSAIARKLLLLMGKEHVTVASGEGKPLDGQEARMNGWEGKGLLAEGEIVKGVLPIPGPDFIVQALKKSQEKMVLVAVGGLTNIALALKEQASLLPRIERIVIMGGCVRPFMLQGKKIPEQLETNLHHDVAAAGMVLRSGLPITLVPAEVTFQTKLFLRDFERIQESSSPLARAMASMTMDFGPRLKVFMKSFGVDTYYSDMATLLHDPLAVYTLVDPSLVKIERVNIRLEISPGKIRTIEDLHGPIPIDLVTAVDAPRFSSRTAERVLEK